MLNETIEMFFARFPVAYVKCSVMKLLLRLYNFALAIYGVWTQFTEERFGLDIITGTHEHVLYLYAYDMIIQPSSLTRTYMLIIYTFLHYVGTD